MDLLEHSLLVLVLVDLVAQALLRDGHVGVVGQEQLGVADDLRNAEGLDAPLDVQLVAGREGLGELRVVAFDVAAVDLDQAGTLDGRVLWPRHGHGARQAREVPDDGAVPGLLGNEEPNLPTSATRAAGSELREAVEVGSEQSTRTLWGTQHIITTASTNWFMWFPVGPSARNIAHTPNTHKHTSSIQPSQHPPEMSGLHADFETEQRAAGEAAPVKMTGPLAGTLSTPTTSTDAKKMLRMEWKKILTLK